MVLIWLLSYMPHVLSIETNLWVMRYYYICIIACFMWHDIESLLVFWWSCKWNCHRVSEDKVAQSYRRCCCRKRSNSDPSYRLWEIYYIPNIAGSTLIILFATTAFSMGIDCPDCKNVIHCDAPSTTEQYIQETGQASRNREIAVTVLYGNHRKDEDKAIGKCCSNSRECRHQALFNFCCFIRLTYQC